VIPDNQKYRAIVEKKALEDALRRVSLLVEQKSRKVVFSLSDATLTIMSKESELGSATEELHCEYAGPQMSFAVNCMYMSEPLREIASETVTMEFSDVNKAITLKPAPDEGYTNIIMPMQLD